MLSYICRLVSHFEKSHGVHPNTLYISGEHCDYLKSAFDESFSLGDIMDMLQMDLIIDNGAVHPRVTWSQLACRVAS